MLLASLLHTRDGALGAYRDRRVPRPVSPEQLAHVRDVLDAVSYVLLSDDEDDWDALETAWGVLKKVAPREPVSTVAGPPIIPEPLE